MYALSVAHFTCNLGYYTLLTCLPQYFKHILHFDIKSVSLNLFMFLLIACNFDPVECKLSRLLCLYVCLSARVAQNTSKLHQFSMHATCGRGLVLL